MFFSTISITNKGKELRTKLILKYPKYVDLLKDYKNLIKTSHKLDTFYPEIKILKSDIAVKKMKKIKK
jgi:hypothetical protein